LRSVPDKLLGVILMFGAIFVWALLPWLDTSRVRSAKFRPIFKQLFWILLVVIWILGMLGQQTPDGYFDFYGAEIPISKLILSQLCTFWYFFHFLVLMPAIGLMETPLPVPESIATAVLAKNGGSAKPAVAVRAPETRV
jgi:ubiquinol-cytochrome c reductase cytochrome b subunit